MAVRWPMQGPVLSVCIVRRTFYEQIEGQDHDNSKSHGNGNQVMVFQQKCEYDIDLLTYRSLISKTYFKGYQEYSVSTPPASSVDVSAVVDARESIFGVSCF